MIARTLLLAGLALAAGQAVAAQSAQPADPQATAAAGVVHLRGLDSLAGRAVDIDIAVGETVRFGRLEILAEACRVPRDDPKGDAYAFLVVRDVREDTPALLGLDVRLVAGALGPRPSALRRLGDRLRRLSLRHSRRSSRSTTKLAAGSAS